MDRISEIKAFLHVFPLQGSHIPDIGSPHVVYHADGTEGNACMDIIFTIKGCPFLCAMYIFCSVHDATLRGQHLRSNQGIAFTLVGFRSWKKQHGSVLQHEA